MYIFDCEWCNLYIWTQRNGSAGACARVRVVGGHREFVPVPL